MSLAVAAQEPDLQLPLLETRRRHLEKLRWQLRLARRAVTVKRKQRQDLEELGDLPRSPGLDAVRVVGFLVGSAAGALLTFLATRWALS